MNFLLDTNICIYAIKKKPALVIKKIRQIGFESLYLSSITLAELEYGVSNSSKPVESRIALTEFSLPFNIINFDFKACPVFGQIRKKLKTAGTIISTLDLLIAAIAVANDLTLVTNNVREFARINGLKYENWV